MRCDTGLCTRLIQMSPTLKFEIDGDAPSIRLDLFLRHHSPNLSRAEIQRCIRSGAASINGCVVANPSTGVNPGDRVEFDLPGNTMHEIAPVPQDIDFKVVYDDDHLIVVDKSTGMAVHAGAGRTDGTLVNALLARYPKLAEMEPVERPGIVHRLDADTSGLLLVGRSVEAATALSAAIKAREVDRRYLAMVVGEMPPGAGVVDRPIGRHPTIRTRQSVIDNGRPARTRFAFVSGFSVAGKALSMVELKLETGRTHQIRVHMQAIGYPILGDPVYGTNLPEIDLCRQFLHAHRLGFTHPITGQAMVFQSPLPDDLESVMSQIGLPSSSTYGG